MPPTDRNTKNEIKKLGWPTRVILEDCYDLRMAVDTLMKEIEPVIAAAMNKGQKTVLLFGEEHYAYAHDRFQAEFLKALHGHYPGHFAYGDEAPHNYGDDALHGLDVNTAKGREARRAPQCAVYTEKLGRSGYPRLKWDVIREFGVSASLNDAAVTGEEIEYCDPSDADTCNVIRSLYKGTIPPQKELVYASDNKSLMRGGLKIRNKVMATKITEHFGDTGAQIYVQSCGAIHLTGDKHSENPYRDSLSQAVKDEGHQVIPILLDSRFMNFSMMPQEGREVMRDIGIIVKGLAEAPFDEVSPKEKAAYDRLPELV